MEKHTITTYNIELSKNPKKISQNITSLSKASGIFCLQEVFKRPGEELIIDRLKRELEGTWDAEYFIGDESEQGILAHGVAILSDATRYRLESIKTFKLPRMERLALGERVLERTIGFAGKPVQRRALSATFRTHDEERIRVTSLHLDSMGGKTNRRKQVNYLFSKLKDGPSVEREVICGDFNTIDIRQKGKERQQLTELFARHGFTDASTDINWSADLLNSDFGGRRQLLETSVRTLNLHLYQKLDYIWSKGLKTAQTYRADLDGSDHRPIITTLMRTNQHPL